MEMDFEAALSKVGGHTDGTEIDQVSTITYNPCTSHLISVYGVLRMQTELG